MKLKMNPSENREQELIEQLRNVPLEDVPNGLSDRVMDRIAAARPSMIKRTWHFVSRSRTISFRPVYSFGIVLMICGSFLLGKSFQPDPDHLAGPPDNIVQVQPENLDNPEAAFMVGRNLLQADNNTMQALAFLRRAAQLEPNNPEFAYWEGVGYWANGSIEEERSSYLRGLESEPRSVPLLINLGHSYLSEKNYTEALAAYQAALALSPGEPTALYNCGLIYRALGKVTEEMTAWRLFLQYNRQGAKAFRAVKRLNDYGDFSFRIYRVGPRKIIVNQNALLDESLPDDVRRDELAPLASILEQEERLQLEVVVFVENDREAARKRAINIKKLISNAVGSDINSQVGLSWFDVPETITIGNRATAVELSEGLLFFARLKEEHEREVSI